MTDAVDAVRNIDRKKIDKIKEYSYSNRRKNNVKAMIERVEYRESFQRRNVVG